MLSLRMASAVVSRSLIRNTIITIDAFNSKLLVVSNYETTSCLIDYSYISLDSTTAFKLRNY
jgi:hypothetical protein